MGVGVKVYVLYGILLQLSSDRQQLCMNKCSHLINLNETAVGTVGCQRRPRAKKMQCCKAKKFNLAQSHVP